jgi:hypothetical protein
LLKLTPVVPPFISLKAQKPPLALRFIKLEVLQPPGTTENALSFEAIFGEFHKPLLSCIVPVVFILPPATDIPPKHVIIFSHSSSGGT